MWRCEPIFATITGLRYPPQDAKVWLFVVQHNLHIFLRGYGNPLFEIVLYRLSGRFHFKISEQWKRHQYIVLRYILAIFQFSDIKMNLLHRHAQTLVWNRLQIHTFFQYWCTFSDKIRLYSIRFGVKVTMFFVKKA